MRKAASIARGAPSETSVPIFELISRSTLMTPRLRLTGSMSTSTRLIRWSCQCSEIPSGNPTCLSTGMTISSCTSVPSSTPIA